MADHSRCGSFARLNQRIWFCGSFARLNQCIWHCVYIDLPPVLRAEGKGVADTKFIRFSKWKTKYLHNWAWQTGSRSMFECSRPQFSLGHHSLLEHLESIPGACLCSSQPNRYAGPCRRECGPWRGGKTGGLDGSCRPAPRLPRFLQKHRHRTWFVVLGFGCK